MLGSSDGFGSAFVIYLVFDFDGRMLFSQQLLAVFQKAVISKLRLSSLVLGRFSVFARITSFFNL